MMDENVEKFMTQHPYQNEDYPILPKQRIVLRINGLITPNNIKTKLIEAYNEDVWEEHITKRLEIPGNAMQRVEWMPLSNIIKKSQARGATIKNLHREINTMSRCKLWNTATSSKCPLCYKKKETCDLC